LKIGETDFDVVVRRSILAKPWRVLESTVTYKDPWITLRSDRCAREGGREIHPYHVLEFPDWVLMVALTPEHDIVLVREYRHGVRKILLGLPSGAVESTDPDPRSAAERELREETGYTVDRVIQIGTMFANPPRQNNAMSVFLGYGARRSETQQLDENEDIDIVPVNFVKFLGQVRTKQDIVLGATVVASVLLAASYLLAKAPADYDTLRASIAQELVPGG